MTEACGIIVRLAEEGDLVALPAIEVAAGAPFRAAGMDAVADDAPPTPEVLRGYVRSGRAWVATTAGDEPVGYLVADVVDGQAHIEQVSIHPSIARRGIGRVLIERCLEWARSSGYQAVTLTTFTEVAWNGPYYERLGFRTLPPDEVGPELLRVRAEEAAKGLDAWPRSCMRLWL